MFEVRTLPHDLARAGRKPRRALRLPAESRSLVNCNQLATSDTKSVPESFYDEGARRNQHRKHRAAQLALHNTLTDTLKALALVDVKANDLLESLDPSERPQDADKGPWSAAKDYRRLTHCQSEWIGFKAKCCDSRAVAVPIGCNHRLCPLCNAGRLEHYRGPARKMLEAMKNPCFLTLTIPNVPKLTKQTFATIRGYWKEFRRANAIVGTGGVYSIEVTFNRQTREWHPHLHILFDSPFRLSMPPRQFIRLKRRLEFAWARITSPTTKRSYKAGEFDRWHEDSRHQERGSTWNQVNRRVIDLRRVQPGDGAVYEVIKYISKTNRFLDIPEAVEAYLRAVRGVRVMQTFGSFYNVNFDDEAAPQTFLKCDCGTGDFERLGLFGLSSVYQAESGVWYLKQRHERRQRCRGATHHEGE